MTSRRRNAPRRARPLRSQPVRKLRNEIKGTRLRLSADPPHFAQIPWHAITVNDSPKLNATTNSKNYTATTIANVFKAQTGCSQATDTLSFRLLSVSVWETTGKKITLEVNDLTIGLGANDYLVQLEDQPGRNHWARVGYRYPTSQNLVIFSGSDTESLVQITTDLGANLIVRFHLLWRFRYNTLPNISVPRSISQRLSDLEQALRQLTLGQTDNLSDGQCSSLELVEPPSLENLRSEVRTTILDTNSRNAE